MKVIDLLLLFRTPLLDDPTIREGLYNLRSHRLVALIQREEGIRLIENTDLLPCRSPFCCGLGLLFVRLHSSLSLRLQESSDHAFRMHAITVHLERYETRPIWLRELAEVKVCQLVVLEARWNVSVRLDGFERLLFLSAQDLEA